MAPLDKLGLRLFNPKVQPNNNIPVNPFQGGTSVGGTQAAGYNPTIGGAYSFAGIPSYNQPDITDVAGGSGTAFYDPLNGHQKGKFNIVG